MKRAAIFIGVAAALVLAFFGSMKLLARHESKRLGLAGSDNSIQHAYAAAETYAWVRAVGVSPETSAMTIVQLGYANEFFENRIQSRDDSTAEIYKDLNNNLSGIVAAAWLEQCQSRGPTERLHAIGALAKDKAIFYFASDKRIPALPQAPDLTAAIAQFEKDRTAIAARIKIDLNRINPCETPSG